MKTNSVKLLSAAMFGLLCQAVDAGNITDVNVSVLPNKQRVIKLRFDSDAVEPSGFVTTSPARIALDFVNTDIKLAQRELTFNDALLNRIEAAQSNGFSRLLLNLGKEGEYNTEVKGNEVWIYVSESKSTNSATSSRASTNTSQYQAQSASVPFSIDFQKGAQGSGIINFISESTTEPKVDIRSDRLIITLKNYPLSTQDQRNFDVTDFSTPVRTISARRLGNDTQITIRNQGLWEHKITTKKGGRVSVQILTSRNADEAGKKAPKKYTGKHISLDFQNIDVRTILQIIGKEAGTNIIAGDSVQGKMTISVHDVPWDQALDLVMDARNLDMRQNGNIINIAPRQELLDKDKAELSALKEVEDLAPLLTKSFQLKYKNVEEFRKVLNLKEGGSRNREDNSILSGRGSALMDPSTNTLIITDTRSVIKKFERLVDELDVPARQVMVEARIVEAAEGFSRDLGVQWGYFRNGNNRISSGITTRSSPNGLPVPNVALPATSVTSSIGLVRAFHSTTLALELNASEAENRSKTISTPRVLTQDRKEAEIRQGVQVPYKTSDGDGNTTTSFKDAMMSLKVTPRITPDNRIILDITITKDQPITQTDAIGEEKSIDTKYLKTQAMIEDGGTLVVGGIYQEVMENGIKKVPLLGDLPVIGNLFKSRSRKHERNELLFFITPRIMGDESSVLRY